MTQSIPLAVRLVGAAALVVAFVHFSAVKLSPDSTYAHRTSLHHLGESYDVDNIPTSNSTVQARAKAAFVILVRDSELWGIMESIRSMEDRFNHKFK
jgi:hypothetical protein